MELRKWMPWNREKNVPVKYEHDPITTLHHRVNQVFDEAFRGFSGFGMTPFGFGGNGWGGGPFRVDVTETPEEFRFEAELPGLTDKDVEVDLADNVLTIQGEKSGETEERKGDYRHVEREFGRFSRTFGLPCEVDADHVEATFKNGLLTVRVPKSPQAQQRVKQIPVKPA